MVQYSNDYYIGDKYHQATYYCQLNINRKCNFKDLMKRYYMQSDDNVKAVSNIEMIDFNMEKILEKCYNGTTKDRLFLYLSMIIADKDEREKIYFLAENSHVIWIPGYRISEYYKVGEDTRRILQIILTDYDEMGK